MKVIKELQKDVIDSNVSLSTALRKAKVLASMLKHEAFKKWVDAELNGYDRDMDVPPYRRFQAQNFGIFSGTFGRVLNNVPIPTYNLPEIVKKIVEGIVLPDGIKALESLTTSKETMFQIKWPAEAIMLVQNKFGDDFALVDAWRLINKSQIEGILDAVRNRLLDFILELQQIKPEIMESEKAISEISEEKVSNVFTVTIYGDHNVLASGIDLNKEPIREPVDTI